VRLIVVSKLLYILGKELCRVGPTRALGGPSQRSPAVLACGESRTIFVLPTLDANSFCRASTLVLCSSTQVHKAIATQD